MDIEKAYRQMQAVCGIEAGDEVEVLRTYGTEEFGSDASAANEIWLNRVGRKGIVANVYPNSIQVRHPDEGSFSHPFFVLRVIKKFKPEKMITIDGKEYSKATVKKALQEYVE